MSTTITRSTWTDDSGGGTDGTIINNARLQADVYDPIDAIFALSGGVVFAGKLTESNRSTAMGYWTYPSFSSSNFLGNGSMTWTLASGDVTTFGYTLIGKTMTVVFDLRTTTVGGTLNTSLLIVIPGSFTANKTVENPIRASDNGTITTAFAQTTAGVNTIALLRNDVANWASSTDNTTVQGQITFEVQ